MTNAKQPAPAGAMMPMAWHYTTGEKFIEIWECGFLRPTKVGIPQGERPILWLSTHQHWEPTASKALTAENGEIVRLSMTETFEICGGLVRFGVTPSTLLPWPKLGQKAGMPAAIVAGLDKVGREQGADPRQWLGTFKNIRISACKAIHVAERGDDGGIVWTPVREGTA